MNTQPVLPAFTVGYAVRGPIGNEEILLGLKKDTPKAIKMEIAGKRMGYGGEIETSDKSASCGFIRECIEEFGDPSLIIDPCDVKHVARIEMRRDGKPLFQLEHFLLRNYNDIPRDTCEMEDAKWYPARLLPENVCGSDKILFPWILSEKMLFGWMDLGLKTSVIDSRIAPFE